MLKIVKRACAATPLLVIFSVTWIPPQASAQLLSLCLPGITCPNPDTTPPTVSITSPASGVTVSSGGHHRAVFDALGHDHRNQRLAYADGGRARYLRQPDDLQPGHDHRFQHCSAAVGDKTF